MRQEQSEIFQTTTIELDNDRVSQIIEPPIETLERTIESEEQKFSEQIKDQTSIDQYQNNKPKVRQITLEVITKSEYTVLYENLQYTVKSDSAGTISQEYRSYSNFEWLYLTLQRDFPGIVVPSIPPKNVLAKLKLSQNQTQAIRDERFYSLQEFLRKVVDHPVLSLSDKVTIFFERSQQVLQKEMNSLENFKPYVSQIGSIIYTTGNNVGNIASSSLKFLGNYIGFGQTRIQIPNSFKKFQKVDTTTSDAAFFDTWEQILLGEKEKLIKINENLQILTNCKLDQANQLNDIGNKITELNGRERSLDKISQCIMGQQNIQQEHYQLIQHVINYPIELYIQDISQALNNIRERSILINKINELVSVLNGNKLVSDQYELFKQEVIQKKELLNKMVQNQRMDLPWFAKNLNTKITNLIEHYYKLIKQSAIQVSNQFIQINKTWLGEQLQKY